MFLFSSERLMTNEEYDFCEDKWYFKDEKFPPANKEIIICYNSSYGTKLVKMTSIEKFGERYRISNFYTSNDIERLIAWKPIHIPE